MRPGADYWDYLDRLVAESGIVIDRAKGTSHPRYPDMVYPTDYGYLEGTRSMDGAGIDVFAGTGEAEAIQGILCVIDMNKMDSEIKVLYRCSEDEIGTVLRFMNGSRFMKALLVRAPSDRNGG